MFGTLITIAISAFGLFLTTPWGASWTNRLRQKRSYARIKGFDRVKIGTRIEFFTADVGGGSAQLGGPDTIWTVTGLSPARVVLTGTGRVVQMTCVEFEKGTAFVVL